MEGQDQTIGIWCSCKLELRYLLLKAWANRLHVDYTPGLRQETMSLWIEISEKMSWILKEYVLTGSRQLTTPNSAFRRGFFQFCSSIFQALRGPFLTASSILILKNSGVFQGLIPDLQSTRSRLLTGLTFNSLGFQRASLFIPLSEVQRSMIEGIFVRMA